MNVIRSLFKVDLFFEFYESVGPRIFASLTLVVYRDLRICICTQTHTLMQAQAQAHINTPHAPPPLAVHARARPYEEGRQII